MKENVEEVLCGLCMKQPEALGRALELGVSPVSFGHSAYAEVFAAMVEAERAGRSYGVVDLSIALPSHVDAIKAAYSQAPLTHKVDPYAREVVERWTERDCIEKMREAAAAMKRRKPFESSEEVRAMASLALERLLSGPGTDESSLPTFADVHTATIGEIEAAIVARQNGQPIGIPTGFRTVDRALGGGWKPGEVATFCALTGKGKSHIAVHTALAAAKAGFKVAFFTIEMTPTQIMRRFIAHETGINSKLLASGDLTNEQKDRLQADAAIRALPITISNKTFGQIERLDYLCRRLKRQGRIDVAVIDYIQQFRVASQKIQMRSQELTVITSHVKHLTGELGITTIMLAQLNRDAAKANEKGQGAGSHHIKDSASIAQDSDILLFLERGDDGSHLVLRKSRHGEDEVVIPVDFDPRTSVFQETKGPGLMVVS